MKKFLFAVAVMAMAGAVSCTKDKVSDGSLAGQQTEEEGEPVSLTVNVETGSTRATGISEETDEKAVSSLQVFIFSDNGKLERAGYASGSSVSISCFSGVKTIVALVNATEIDWSTISSKGQLDETVTLLTQDNKIGKFLMYGFKTFTVSETTSSTSISVSRRVARVVLKKITNAISNEASIGNLTVNAIYLINVVGNSVYSESVSCSPETWLNRQSYTRDGPDLLYDDGLNESISRGKDNATAHYFYCYPNPTATDSYASAWSARFTRLVVEASLNGNVWYYPITLGGIQANHSYEITDLKITGPGASAPDNEPQVTNFKFTLEIKGWEKEETESTI